MKFLMTYESNPNAAPPSPEVMAKIGQYSEEMIRSGVVVLTGGLQRASKGTRVKYAGGKFSATDGPFAETKELIDGFVVVRVNSKEEALGYARRFMEIAGDGEGEVLQLFDSADAPPPC